MTKSNSDIIFMAYDKAYGKHFEDMPKRLPDILRINQLTGYKPNLGIREILKKVIENFEES